MDLNQLLFHHQVALIRDAESGPAGPASLSGHYADRIERLRRQLGAMPWAPKADALPFVPQFAG